MFDTFALMSVNSLYWTGALLVLMSLASPLCEIEPSTIKPGKDKKASWNGARAQKFWAKKIFEELFDFLEKAKMSFVAGPKRKKSKKGFGQKKRRFTL